MKRLTIRVRRAPIGVVWLALIGITTGCADTRPPSGSPGAVEPEPTDRESSAFLEALPLDPASVELLPLIDPQEVVRVTIATTWTDELAAAVASSGMKVEVLEAGASIAIDGQLRPALGLLRGVPVTSVTIADLTDAMRPLPAVQPAVTVPTSGRPYLVSGFADLGEVAMGESQRAAMLRSLASAVETIDGHPYARLEISGGCSLPNERPPCRITAIGYTAGAGGFEDDIGVEGDETGAAVEAGGALRLSVPRPLLRSAEWVARHDDASVAVIRTYTWCCVASWDPARPGWITIRYERQCLEGAALLGREVADTGECFDVLRITVDVGTNRVVSRDEDPGTS